MLPDNQLPESARKLKNAKDALWARAEKGSVGGFAWEYSHLVNQYFEERVCESGHQRSPFALVAVGGYGRGRLCPGSDIDILMLFKRKIPDNADQFVKTLLFPLWDLGLDLGHGVRTISDCLSLAKKDFQVLASLLDARPLAGHADVFKTFLASFDKKVLRKCGGIFANSLREHNRSRGAQYGDSSGMLEPELKNGLGGLRDGQQIFWLNRVLEARGEKELFLPEELFRLREDQAFLNRVRTALHLAAKRKTDRLFFDLQPPTARLMGFASMDDSAQTTGRAVEFFLSRLHQAMTRIKTMHEALFQEKFPANEPVPIPEMSIRNLGAGAEGIYFKSQAAITPDNVLGAFLESARNGLPLTWGARRLLRRNPGNYAEKLADRPETLSSLLEIFMAPNANKACDGLLETRLLQAILPEFGKVEHLIQFNDYHVQPVGRHILSTVRQLAAFFSEDGKWTSEIAARTAHPKRLMLAGLFHDLGKGEANHSRTGAGMAMEVLARYDMDEETIKDVHFLVLHHLLIQKTALRRDLADERVAAMVAEIIDSTDRLDMLYLLSVADSMATGPRAWNNWTRSLFAELYFKVRNLLEHGPLSEPDAAKRLVQTRDRVRAATREMDPAFVDAALEAMPPRAFLALDPATLAAHVSLVRRLWEAVATDRIRKPSAIGGRGVNLVEAQPGTVKGTFRLTIAAVDRTGLFAIFAGAIALHGLNILAADLFTWSDGTAVDVLTVDEPFENLFADEVWARIRRSIGYALVGKLDLAARLEERRNSILHKARTGPRLRPIVTMDNESSDFYTVLEVAATDRTGLLFDMARILAEHNVSIHMAKITTSKGRAADIFYVRDETGQKLTDQLPINNMLESMIKIANKV